MSDLITIHLDGEPGYKPGEELVGEVSWRLRSAPLAGVLTLGWSTSGKGAPDGRLVRTLELAELLRVDGGRNEAAGPYRESPGRGEKSPLQADDRRRFRIAMPQEPYSFVGKLIRLNWDLEARADSETSTMRVVLSPTRQLINLSRIRR